MATSGKTGQRGNNNQVQPMPTNTLVGLMVAMLIMMVVVSFREPIGSALDTVFHYIDFDGKYPVLTLVIAGTIMITLSTLIRSFLSDPVQMARSQHIQSQFNAELREARITENKFKEKRLMELQPQMMSASMEQSAKQMKLMPVTMVVVIPIYAWIWYFISNTATVLVINMPWGTANLETYLLHFMPVWIVVYTLISLPIGQLENKIINYFLFKKRVAKMDAAGDV